MKNKIRQVRMELGITQTACARRSGITRQALRDIELHGVVPSVLTALRLARVLGTSPEDLFPDAVIQEKQAP